MRRIEVSLFWSIIGSLFSGLIILITINYLFTLRLFGFQPLENSYLYYILALSISLVFLYYPATKSGVKDKVPWYDIVLFLLTIITNIYLGIHGLEILTRGWEYNAPPMPTMFSILLWVLALEAVRRATDIVMMFFCLFFSLYPLFASSMPGVLQGQSTDFLTLARLHSMGMSSILGIPLLTVCTLLIGFLVFGAVLQGTGGGTFFFNIATALLGHTRGGAAKIGIVGSAFFGMLSGSSVSNVLTTGSMTIPAMKRSGFAPHYAAAIESCASAGGPIMPPVMGAAAFVMASFLEMPYSQIILGAAIPACLYFIVLFVQVDAYSAKTGMKGMPKEERPPFWGTLKDGWFYFLVIFILVYFLLTLRREAHAPFYASAVLIFCAMLKKETRLTWRNLNRIIINSGKIVVQIVAILAAAGLLIGSLSLTGVALSFSRELVVAVGGNTFLILLVGAITSFVLGLGMTTTACYIFLAIVMAPALVQMGIDPLAAHLFVFYWGALSELTPPTAFCVTAACGLAGSEFLKTAFLATRLGAGKYILPFFFVYSPALLTHGTWLEVILYTVLAINGLVFLGCALEGYLFGIGKINWPVRISLIIGGILTAFPEMVTSVIGLIVIFGTVITLFLLKRIKRKSQDI